MVGTLIGTLMGTWPPNVAETRDRRTHSRQAVRDRPMGRLGFEPIRPA
jgi:hypothetical protein